MRVQIDERFAELTEAAKGATHDQYVGGIALGRAQTPADVAPFASLLARPDSRLQDRPAAAYRRRTCLPLSHARKNGAPKQ